MSESGLLKQAAASERPARLDGGIDTSAVCNDSECDGLCNVDLPAGSATWCDVSADFASVMSDGADTTLVADPAGNGCFTDIAVFRSITAGSKVCPCAISAGINFIPDGAIQGEM